MDVVQTQRNMARRTSATQPLATSQPENSPLMDESPKNNSPSDAATTTDTAVTRPGPFARFRRSTNSSNTTQRRSYSAPAAPGRRQGRTNSSTRSRRRLLMEDHFNVETTSTVIPGRRAQDQAPPPPRVVERPVVLPGVPHYDPDWARDSHDFFNLIVLIPIVALNIMNWNWDPYLSWWVTNPTKKMLKKQAAAALRNNDGVTHSFDAFQNAWTGEWFQMFFYVTLAYFLIDLIWVLVVPKCVKSPATIVQHHVATMIYLLIPFYHQDFQWCMGACMIVEVNTWFLIARRVFNRQGFPPWCIIDLGSFASIRVKLISVFFYVTWIGIRCILYPYLFPLIYDKYIFHSEQRGTYYNMVAMCVPLHAAFCLLNLKWTYDLFTSKLRFWARKNRSAKETVDKGL